MTSSTIAPINTQTAYLPSEFDLPQDAKLMAELLAQRERITATVVNLKEIAQYEKRELLTGQQWFNPNVSNASSTSSTRQPVYGFRLTFDLVSLNGGNIANGATTTISLPTNPATNTPICINYATGLIPLKGYGACTSGGVYYFVNDPLVYVRYTNTSQTVQSVAVTNNTGSAITQMYFVFEYQKV